MDMWNAALQHDDVDAVRRLVATRPYQDSNGRTALHDACHFGASKVVAWLLQEQPQALHEPDVMKEMPLHRAVYAASLPCIQQLLAAGAAVNAPNWFNAIPLHYVSAQPRPHSTTVIRDLLAAGADPTWKSKQGLTPKDMIVAVQIAWPVPSTH